MENGSPNPLSTPPAAPSLEAGQGMSQAAMMQLIFEQQSKLEEIHVSVEKTRKYFLWTLILTLFFLIVPLIIMAIVLPKYASTFTGSGIDLQNLGL